MKKPLIITGIAFLLILTNFSYALDNKYMLESPEDTLEKRRMGKETAHVTVSVYLDYKDYLSMKWHNVKLPLLIDKYVNNGDVEVRFFHFPYDPFHPPLESLQAAQASECAARQGLYFEYINTLYNNQKQFFSATKLREFAEQTKLNMDNYDRCISDSTSYKIVTKEVSHGKQIMSSPIITPTFFVNGEEVKGNDPTLFQTIDYQLSLLEDPVGTGKSKLKKKMSLSDSFLENINSILF